MEDNDIAADTVKWKCDLCGLPSVYAKGYVGNNCKVCDLMLEFPEKYTVKQVLLHFQSSRELEKWCNKDV